jgi:hypothetical protein
MKYSLTTTPQRVIEPQDYPRIFLFSAALFSTAVAVYIAPQGSKSVQLVLSANGTTQGMLSVPNGVSLDAYTDAGTAEIAVMRSPCPVNFLR